jgi:hypothetical protein
MTNSAQIIRDQNGNPAFAVLPIDEYERLLEVADEAASIRAYDAYKATQPETFPDEVASRLLNGEHPVKVFREYRAKPTCHRSRPAPALAPSMYSSG